jgi:hypothetical protein
MEMSKPVEAKTARKQDTANDCVIGSRSWQHDTHCC